jgi:hypothetical protein
MDLLEIITEKMLLEQLRYIRVMKAVVIIR